MMGVCASVLPCIPLPLVRLTNSSLINSAEYIVIQIS